MLWTLVLRYWTLSLEVRLNSHADRNKRNMQDGCRLQRQDKSMKILEQTKMEKEKFFRRFALRE